MPTNVKGDASLMQKAALLAFTQTTMQLKDVDLSSYEDVIFIGKSLGTVALAKYVSENAPNAAPLCRLIGVRWKQRSAIPSLNDHLTIKFYTVICLKPESLSSATP